MKAENTMDAYDALCLEQEKQAALIDVLKQALCSGPLSIDLSDYMAVVGDQHARATAAGAALYEAGIQGAQ